jgi:hypothetical protein
VDQYGLSTREEGKKDTRKREILEGGCNFRWEFECSDISFKTKVWEPQS